MVTAVDNQRLGTYADMSAFAGLRSAAQQDSKAALPAVAKQFESIFTQMMLKSMRDASAAMGGDDIMGSSEANSYRDMLDHQLSVTLSQGRGIGIADMLVRQLGGASASGADRDNGLFAGVTGSASTADAVSSPSDQDSGLMSSLERMLGSAGRAAGQGAQAVANAVGSIDSPQEFVEKFAPHAIEAAKKLGVSVRALLAQAALETGWGKHMPAQGATASNNMFGIKAGSSWDGKRVNVPTLESKTVWPCARRIASARTTPRPIRSRITPTWSPAARVTRRLSAAATISRASPTRSPRADTPRIRAMRRS
jgi:Rod binding protein